jgi:hypothetical protein
LREVLLNHTDYKKRYPFPYAVIDELFPRSVIDTVMNEIPDIPQVNNNCVISSTSCINDEKYEKNKSIFENDYFYGPATAALFAFIKSSHFVRFLELLSGIEDIIPDPHYRGAGIHQILPGGFTGIHADANYYEKYQLHRRINVFLYLNPNWEDSFEGHLELWDRNLKQCGSKIRPKVGRLVVFSSTDFTYYGSPHPLHTQNRSSRSLVMYYYTATRSSTECIWWSCKTKHSTWWQTPACKSCSDEQCRNYRHII